MFVAEALDGDAARADAPSSASGWRSSTSSRRATSPRSSARSTCWATRFEPDEFLSQLEAEHRVKPEVRQRRGIGFLH